PVGDVRHHVGEVAEDHRPVVRLPVVLAIGHRLEGPVALLRLTLELVQQQFCQLHQRLPRPRCKSRPTLASANVTRYPSVELLRPVTATAPRRPLSSFWEECAFSLDGHDILWIDVAIGAMVRGEWAGFERRLAEGLACAAKAR